jgi:hypothetical protein
MRSLTRSKAVAALTAGLVIAGGGIAAADDAISDGDGLAVPSVTNQDWVVGSVCTGSSGSRSIPVGVFRAGNSANNTFANGSTVTVNRTATGLIVENGPKSITLPTNWATLSNGTVASTTFNVSYTAPSTPGPFTGSVEFTGSGTSVDSRAFSKSDTLRVSGNAVACDTTPPVITPNVSGTLGDNDWYTSDVDLNWSVVDAESTVTSSTGCDAVAITADQAATTYTCSATSSGGTGSQSVSIKRDATAPVITPGDVNDTTWRTTPLSQTFTTSDATSGLATPGDASFTLEASAESADANTPTSDSRTVSDNAGNSTTRTLSARIDQTSPVVSYTSVSGTTGTNGWYTSAVVATFTALDALSGPASQTGTASSGTTEGEVTLFSGVFSDTAGNTTAAGAASQSFNVDLSDPTVPTFSSFPTAAYATMVPPAPTCASSDAVSGLASCVVTGYSTAVGTHTLTATATDNAGRTATETLTYTVSAWTLRGFFSPVDMAGVWNTVKGGSTVPLKFEAFAGTELTSISAIRSFTQRQVSCSAGTTLVDDIEVTTTGGTSLRYDATAGQFIQNWQTPKKPSTCWIVTMTTQDGSTLSANFMLK